MKFQKGMAKPEGSGRQKGTPNKKTVMKTAEVLADRDLNPTVEILKIIEELTTPSAKLQAWELLLSYTQAKPKDIEPNSSDGDESTDPLEQFTDEELLALRDKVRVIKPPEAV